MVNDIGTPVNLGQSQFFAFDRIGECRRCGSGIVTQHFASGKRMVHASLVAGLEFMDQGHIHAADKSHRILPIGLGL